ncbi:MAG: esterase family protein [Prevotellaceae bacterium]|jgi:enterochelin esterase-like enzyme|nr:esterase family protein [Prevotellaceae bacterium]
MKRPIVLLLFAAAVTGAPAQQGRVFETRTVTSNILKMERRYAVYLPPDYDHTDRSYPVLYLLHGSGDDHTGWVQFGQVQHIADRAIAEGKATPMIIVMPDANTTVRGYFNQPDGSFDYERFFFDELIAHIETAYRVRSERRYRAIAGLSMGGGGAIYYTLHRPEFFAAAAPLSASVETGRWFVGKYAALSPQQQAAHVRAHTLDSLLAPDVGEEYLNRIRQVRWYVSCGDDDFLYRHNSLLHILFRDRQIAHEYRVKDGGHSWTYWRGELPEVLEFVSKSFMQY